MRPATLARHRAALAAEELPADPSTPQIAAALLADLDEAQRNVLANRPPTPGEASVYARMRAAVVVQLAYHHSEYAALADALILSWRALTSWPADGNHRLGDRRRVALLRRYDPHPPQGPSAAPEGVTP